MSRTVHRVWLTIQTRRELRLAGDIETELSTEELRKELCQAEPMEFLDQLRNVVIYSKKENHKVKVDITLKKEQQSNNQFTK